MGNLRIINLREKKVLLPFISNFFPKGKKIPSGRPPRPICPVENIGWIRMDFRLFPFYLFWEGPLFVTVMALSFNKQCPTFPLA